MLEYPENCWEKSVENWCQVWKHVKAIGEALSRKVAVVIAKIMYRNVEHFIVYLYI